MKNRSKTLILEDAETSEGHLDPSVPAKRLRALKLAVTLVLAGIVVGAGPAEAATSTRTLAAGTRVMAGAEWLGGGGVPIYSNGSSASSTWGDSYVAHPNGSVVYAGYKWQCVELVNRLYIRKGWISSRWTGNGGTMYGTAPSHLKKQANGSITVARPGDVVVLSNGGAGHVGIVDRTSGSTVYVVNQNTADVRFTMTLSNGRLSSPFSGFSVVGIVHRPV